MGRGIEPAAAGLRELLGHFYLLMVEEYSSVWSTTAEVRAAVDGILENPDGLMPRPVVVAHLRKVEAERRATWGRTPEAVAGYMAAVGQFGPAAVPGEE